MIRKITPLNSRIIFLCQLLILAVLSSCNPDPITDHGVYTEAPVVPGLYRLTVMQTNNASNLNGKSQTAINLVDALDCLQVTLELFEDGSLKSTYTDLQTVTDAEGNYEFHCGSERVSTGTWTADGNALSMDNVVFLIQDNQLIDARNRDKELIDLVVYTKIQ